MPDTRRPVGRPRINTDDTTTSLSVSLPTKQYDDLWHRARRAGVSMSEMIRRRLQDDDDQDGDD